MAKADGRCPAVAAPDRAGEGGAWCWRMAGAADAEDEGHGRMKLTRSVRAVLISCASALFAPAACATTPQPPRDIYELFRDLGQLGNLADYRKISALLRTPITPTFSDYNLFVEYIRQQASSILPGLHVDRYAVAYPGSVADGQSTQPHGSLILQIGTVKECVTLSGMKKNFGEKPSTRPMTDVSGLLYEWKIPSRGSRSLRAEAFFGSSSQNCAYDITLSQ